MRIWLFLVVLALAGLTYSEATTAPKEDPEFTDQIENVTVAAGRSVKLACSVKNLGTYKCTVLPDKYRRDKNVVSKCPFLQWRKSGSGLPPHYPKAFDHGFLSSTVAWMHFEQSAILTVHTHVITRNPRISVSHDKHRTWILHINNVQEEDKGRYMCQINTVTAKTQFGYLHVVVPPNIDDSLSSSDVIVREGANVSLTCNASGSPTPSVKWKRDDGTKININKSLSVSEWEGGLLELTRISRLDMGAYLCIASNGVPPTVSKRIKVSVDFPPMLWIPHQLVGAPLGYSVTLECFTEAHPSSLNYWTREDGHMIHESKKYKAENSVGSPSYKTHMKLTIANIQEKDYGTYKCVAKNPRGETDGTIRLYTSAPPSTSPTPTTTDTSLEKTLDASVNEKGQVNNSIYGNYFPSSDKGSKYLSPKLNEIGKSEHKSSDGAGKGTVEEWPQRDADASGGTRATRGFATAIAHIIPFVFHLMVR